jgi:anaerobic selenocysteine-containing dehydrogenase
LNNQAINQEEVRVVKSACAYCQIGCGILVYVKNGRVVKVEGDPECPFCKGVICPKGKAAIEYLYHPDRLLRPLKRMGKKGEGKWQAIDWDEALDIVADNFIDNRDKYGVESVAFIRGAAKGLYDDYLARFTNLFGSPNITSMAHLCFMPRVYASMLTYGFYAIPDYECPPDCIIIWGNNVSENLVHVYPRIEMAHKKGAKLIVVDPKKIKEVDLAELWLKPRPGSDLALALGMLNVIISEDLYDKKFVEQWTLGFNELKYHIQDYTPEKVAEITWVPVEHIVEAARLFATSKSACIQWGNGIDDGVNSMQTARAIAILRAVTGNLEIPGGDLNWAPVPLLKKGSPPLTMQENITPEVRQKRITTEQGLFPMAFYALPQALFNAILEGKPYPIRSVYVFGSNPLLTLSNAKRVFEALSKVDFLVVTDMFMTPTAALADVVLPIATYLEFDSIVSPPYSIPAAIVQQKVTRVGEARSDFEVFRDLARRLGFGERYWDSEEQALDQILEPAGITFNEFRKIGKLLGSKQYRSYLNKGFNTPSGKVELYSKRLEEWGFDPLPVYYERPESPFSADLVTEYPLVMTSGQYLCYRHSSGRQIKGLRDSRPEPLTYINTQTAQKLEIEDGDWVYIETKRGAIKQKAALTDDMDPRVVWVDYCWWYPEDASDKLFGWDKANYNILTDDSPPFNKEMGTPNLRGIPCKVYKA